MFLCLFDDTKLHKIFDVAIIKMIFLKKKDFYLTFTINCVIFAP